MIVALPGNPVSALTGLHVFVLPALAVAPGLTKPPPRLVVMDDRTQQLADFTRHLAVMIRADGRALLRRCYDLLRDVGCERIVILLRHDQEIPAGMAEVEVVRDLEGASRGPFAGIVSGMKLAPDADWLVRACDLPRLDAATLRHLMLSKREDEIFLAYRSEFDGRPEPLCTLYS